MEYRFAAFTINSDTRQLLAGTEERHVSPKAFDLLLLLLQHRSRALSKAELQERLWPSTFVGETNLATLVAEIRRALGDTAQDSAYLRTVHRFGYRFVASVDERQMEDAGQQLEASMYLATTDQEYRLLQGASVIGRARDATIRVDSGGVSRHHARILVQGAEARVADLGSKNGTFVNGQRVTEERLLADGSELRIGPVAFIFRVSAPTMRTETVT